jgi:hypothetical protein
MASELAISTDSGLTLRVLLYKSDYTIWNGTAFVAYSGPDLDSYKITATDVTGRGDYTATMPAVAAGRYTFQFIDNSDDTLVGGGVIDWDGTSEVSATEYYADINFTRDSATQDEYTVQWYRNGSPITSGITSPTIQVVNRADGSDLVASTSMTAISDTGALKYDAPDEKQTRGQACLVVVTASIDGATRTWRRVLGRDA